MAGFNFGHASRWQRQQMEKKAELKATITFDETDSLRAIESMKRELEAKIAEAAAAEEWVWVEGYKGTKIDMKCRDYQFEMSKQFDMPEGADIIDCESGFHFCRDLKDVFHYYEIGEGNRFFRVRALVRKKDYENYGKKYEGNANSFTYYIYRLSFAEELRDKLAAKSIQFLYELTPAEVFDGRADSDKYKDWSLEDKKLAMERGIKYVQNIERVKTLVSLGYSDAFAQWVVENHKYYNTAVAVGSQEGISMDMKVLAIIKG